MRLGFAMLVEPQTWDLKKEIYDASVKLPEGCIDESNKELKLEACNIGHH